MRDELTRLLSVASVREWWSGVAVGACTSSSGGDPSRRQLDHNDLRPGSPHAMTWHRTCGSSSPALNRVFGVMLCVPSLVSINIEV